MMPLSRAEWITGDNETVPMPTYYELPPGLSRLKFVGSSPEADFDHVITVRVTVLPKLVASMIPVINLLSRLLQRMGVIR